MNPFGLMLRQVRFENRAFWRNPAVAFFTFVFPLMFLVIFNVLFTDEIDIGNKSIAGSNFYVPVIGAFAIITACYTNLAMSISFSKDEGILKRKRGTPLPSWAFLGGRILHSILIALLLIAIVVAFGSVFYDVEVAAESLPEFLLTIVVGAITFCSLGLAITSVVPNADAAPAVINFSILPLLFISDIFIPTANAPDWITTVAEIFPIKPFSDAMKAAFNPDVFDFEFGDLLFVLGWGVLGIVLATRFFTWEPNH